MLKNDQRSKIKDSAYKISGHCFKKCDTLFSNTFRSINVKLLHLTEQIIGYIMLKTFLLNTSYLELCRNTFQVVLLLPLLCVLSLPSSFRGRFICYLVTFISKAFVSHCNKRPSQNF